MNKPQKFYNQYSFTWKFTLLLAVILLLLMLHYFDKNDYVLTNVMCYFLLPSLLFFILATIISYKNWRARNLTLTTEGITTYHRFKAQRIIPWNSIQSMEYTINNNIFKKFKAHLPIGAKLEIATIVYRVDFSSTQKTEILLTSFSKYSGRFIFDLMEKQCEQLSHKIKPKSIPKLNEKITYNTTINQSILLPIVHFVGILIFLFLLIVIQDVKILGILIATISLLPFSIYSYLISIRSITIIATVQGIQDEWLHKNNCVILWANVHSIEIHTHAPFVLLGQISSRYIAIELKNDSERYINVCSQWQRFLLKFGKFKNLPYFFITENTQKYSLDDIHEMLTEEWQKHTKH